MSTFRRRWKEFQLQGVIDGKLKSVAFNLKREENVEEICLAISNAVKCFLKRD